MADGHPTSPTSFALDELFRTDAPLTPMETVQRLIGALALPCPPALERFIAAEIGKERNRYAHWNKDAERSRGACWSGLGPDPFEPRPAEAIIEAAKAALASQEEFDASPRGRFCAACVELLNLGFYEAQIALNIYSASLADARQPLNAAAVGRAIRELNGLDHSTARAAVAALCDLLAAKPLAEAA